jgi:hypothetical protein
MPSKKLFIALFILVLSLPPSASKAATYDDRWVASAGIGMMVDPTLVLFTPQLEYAVDKDFHWGPILQMGLGSSTLITASWAGRYLPLLGLSRLKPYLEGGLGIAVSGGNIGAGLGVNVMVGVGLDYRFDGNMSVATAIRGNLCPPIQTALLTWPMLIGRFAL